MTPSSDATTFKNPQYAESEGSVVLPKQRSTPDSSISDLPYYRLANPALYPIFASTSSLPQSRHSSGTSTPLAGSVFSQSTLNGTFSPDATQGKPDEPRNLVLRAFVPHVGVLASADTEEMMLQKGFPGGFLDLIRPYGETVPGKVTVRDSIGSSKTHDDYGIRFVGLRDGLGQPRPPSNRPSYEVKRESTNGRLSNNSKRQSALGIPRIGGNVSQVEDLVDRHLSYSELQASQTADFLDFKDEDSPESTSLDAVSPFYSLYLRRLLSGLPMSPHETFSHPVACVIAISSRNPSPIEELRRLYQSTNTGDDRLPQWVNNEYLRYYVLVHDEDNDDINKSISLYEQMKRHFGLHCHLLRLRSIQCVESDDDSIRLARSSWISAGEELAEILRQESIDVVQDPTPFIFESDRDAILTFVRELVTQSIIPSMERLSATWNEHIATRRRGLTGRITSLTKRWTPFGSGRNSSSPVSALQSSSVGNSNYDSLQGFYRPDAPEALMRKLADYAFMLRDWKLAQSTYDLLRQDYDNDKAWKYYAGANEMAAISMLLLSTPLSSKSRSENLDRMLEASMNSYVHRCIAPYYALRSLVLGLELLRIRGAGAIDDAAKWSMRILEMGLVGPIGHALLTERAAACYFGRKGVGSLNWGGRKRKAAFWAMLASEDFLKLGKVMQAEKCLSEATMLYGIDKEEEEQLGFWVIRGYIEELGHAITTAKAAQGRYDENWKHEGDDQSQQQEQLVEEVSEQLDTRPHRHSLIGRPLDSAPLSPVRTKDDPLRAEHDNFE